MGVVSGEESTRNKPVVQTESEIVREFLNWFKREKEKRKNERKGRRKNERRKN